MQSKLRQKLGNFLALTVVDEVATGEPALRCSLVARAPLESAMSAGLASTALGQTGLSCTRGSAGSAISIGSPGLVTPLPTTIAITQASRTSPPAASPSPAALLR